MYKLLLLFVSLIAMHSEISAQYDAKMSSYVRQASLQGKSRSKGINGYDSNARPTLTAFVRTSDTDLLHKEGCHIYAQWDDIVIAGIPLDKIHTLAANSKVQRIEASESCFVTLDTTAVITKTNNLWNASEALANYPFASQGLKGSSVVVGVMDIGFDLTHPTFMSADGKRCRIKALWDMLDFSDSGDAVVGPDTIFVGRQYFGDQAIAGKRYSADALQLTHGTHTSGIAAGSGAPFLFGEGETVFSGMAPDADICLVSNCTSDDKDIVPEGDWYKYTTATDMLGFKYIFDYAESQGKPCVINFSEGARCDLYESRLYQEVLDKMVGPGRIICSSAGNEGISEGTYMHKKEGVESTGAFLAKWASNTGIYVMKSKAPVKMRLSFYRNDSKAVDWDYDLTELANYPDSVFVDTINIDDEQLIIYLNTYPSCFDESLLATDFAVVDKNQERLGYSNPISFQVFGEDNDIEVYSGGGFFVKNSLDPKMTDYEVTHNILFPAALSNIVCVGASAYVTDRKNIFGDYYGRNWGSGGRVASFSSIGPAISGILKPDVIAPGTNIVSSYGGYYRAENPEVDDVKMDILRKEYNGIAYPWTMGGGTSMSTPVVTGIVALWLEACSTLTPDQVKDVFAHTCAHNDNASEYPNVRSGYGEIDALAGLEYIMQTYNGIKNIKDDASLIAGRYVYDLNGIRVQEECAGHGIYIVVKNGKARKIVR